jgi:asparagine synthase (glutamine-hydrolysing)
MCGIVGFVAHTEQKSLSEAQLIVMRDRMISRGPDDAGTSLHRQDGLWVGLAHRRLSIIDLSPLGHQPMSTADGTLRIVFNGEIFNYQELRTSLLQTGRYTFHSKSDTEVLLYAVREWGLEGCLHRIRGMYAFALYDQLAGTLTLVRDPLGVKPLYFRQEQGRLLFASEIKAILAAPDVPRTINDQALYHYLTFANVPAPLTMFEGISKLEAGTYLTFDRQGQATQVRYWDPTAFAPSRMLLSEQDYIAELRGLLRQSVARRMVSDVPFGVFLSGGVDSSLNVALMAELLGRPVETFSIGIKDDPSNEFLYARQVAQHFRTNHHEMVIDDNDFLSFLPQMAYMQDEPLADPVCVPIYYISKLARESGTPVIQVGEGSDEIFAGYQTYHLFDGWNRRYYEPYLKMPHVIRASTYALLRHFVSSEKQDALRRASHGEPLFLGNAIAFWDCEKTELLKPPFLPSSTSSRYIKDLEASLAIQDPLLRIIQIELKNRLPELLLMRVDKMSMASSIETRVPFLDEDLVAFALTIPSSLKFKNGQPKYILKQAARGLIPDAIIDRKKWGFCGSATNMLSDPMVEYARTCILSSPLIRERFHRGSVEALFRSHRDQKRFNSFKIWNLLNLVLWHHCWFEEAGAAFTNKSDGSQV